MFTCAFCRYSWSPPPIDKLMGLSEGIYELRGTVMATATVDIASDDSLVALKCTGCGADVVINTDASLQARCHWCRHTLSLNDRIDNGAVPDGILPFQITKEQAMAAITSFAAMRQGFQHPSFRTSFEPANVMGVYLPYMTVDAHVAVRLEGVGEIYDRGWHMTGGESDEYHVNEFSVARTLGVLVDDVEVPSASGSANPTAPDRTNNILGALLPFDVKNMVRFDAHYLGTQFSAARRDMNVQDAEGFAYSHVLTIARNAVRKSLARYERGVRWDAAHVGVVGSRWTSVLAPVWLYGFVEDTASGPVTHYVGVNGRTGVVMGSIPIDRPKLVRASWLAGIATFVLGILSFFITAGIPVILAPFVGWGVYWWFNRKYRNDNARYKPEAVVAQSVFDLKEEDRYTGQFVRRVLFVEGRNEHDPTKPIKKVTISRA